MTKPLVSVAVPSYNQSAFLGQTLDSILAQDYRPIKVIIADDGSSDNSQTLIREYAARHPDIITPLLHEKNMGVNANMASIYPHLEGKYVFWFAGDDLFLPGKISKQVALMEANPDMLFCYHDVEAFRDTQILYRQTAHLRGRPNSENVLQDILLMRAQISTLSLMVNREHPAKVKHRAVTTLSSDWILLIDLAVGGKAGYIPEVLARYRRHDNNLSRKVDYSDEAQIYQAIEASYPDLATLCAKGVAALQLKYVFKYLLQGRISASLRMGWRVLCTLAKHPSLAIFFAQDMGRRLYTRLTR
jgi:glycosyltransferase involved in cell wall biosynthesis